MKLSEFKKLLQTVDQINFKLPNGKLVPAHYHVTEVGAITKNFIDCGGTTREEKNVNFQLWFSDDTDHQLQPQKLLDIIGLSETKLGIEDNEIEVEYQSDTIGKYGLDFDGRNFLLTSKMTDCLAPDKCMTPAEKPKVKLSSMIAGKEGCDPDSGCC